MAKRRSSSKHSIWWWLFVSWWIWIVYLIRAIIRPPKKSQKVVSSKQTAPAKVNLEAASFEAVGVNYRVDNLLSLAEPSRSYSYEDDKILGKYPEGQKLYKYFFSVMLTVRSCRNRRTRTTRMQSRSSSAVCISHTYPLNCARTFRRY